MLGRQDCLKPQPCVTPIGGMGQHHAIATAQRVVVAAVAMRRRSSLQRHDPRFRAPSAEAAIEQINESICRHLKIASDSQACR